MIALAEAIGLPFETKRLEYNALRRLGPKLIGSSFLTLTRSARRALLEASPPDLTISVGHRSVPVVLALRRRAGGRMRTIHVGFPRISPGHFDLLISTPQYPLAEHPRLLRLPFALTRVATDGMDRARVRAIEDLEPPRRLLVVGGQTLFWKLDETLLLETVSEMLEEAARQGGSVLVTTSPRTPRRTREAIRTLLEDSASPSLLASPGRPPSYHSLLAAADSIRVTADSVAMVSDAIWTGKSLAVVPVAKSTLGRFATTLVGNGHLYPRDLRRFWTALARIGVTERLGVPRISARDQYRLILERVNPILDSLR